MNKRLISFVLVLSIIACLFSGLNLSVSAANEDDLFADLAFGVSQSGHILNHATNYYKFTLPSYTTLKIKYDTAEEAAGYDYYINGNLEVFKVSSYNDRELGKGYKTYFNAETTRLNDNCTYYEGTVSLYAGTYYLALKAAKNYNYDPGSSNRYTISLKPTVIKLTEIGFSCTSSSIRINWMGDLGAKGYQIQRKTSGKYKDLKTVYEESYNDKKLKAGTMYEYRVRGYASVGGKNYYGEWKYLTAVTAPDIPVIKTPSTNKKHQITVKWKRVSAGTGYQMQFSKNKWFTSIVSTKTVSGITKTSGIDSNFKKGKTYYIRVRSYKTLSGKKYYGAWSKVKSIKCK